MAANFNFPNSPRIGLSKGGKENLIHPSARFPGHSYVFTVGKTANADEKILWRCTGYFKMKKTGRPEKIAYTSTVDGRLEANPEFPINPHMCHPLPNADIEATQIVKETVVAVAETGMRPKRAFHQMLATANQRHAADFQLRHDVEDQIQFKRVKSALQRSVNDKFPTVTGIMQIPAELTKDLEKAISTDPADPIRHTDDYLRVQTVNPACLVFASDLDLEVLHQSQHWTADGTFKSPPDKPVKFTQLYVIFGQIRGESVPLVHALLHDKSHDTYVRLFEVIRDLLVAKFGGVGVVSRFHIDFEPATISAVRQVFSQAQVTGCLFHYSQALHRHLGEVALRTVYIQAAANPIFAPVKLWIRRLVGLSLLPPVLVIATFQQLLQPPIICDRVIDANLRRFHDYFSRQWVRNQQQVDICNHFDHNGPRTTNSAEGYNNSLREKLENRIHPTLSVFLVLFQEFHHAKQVRIRNLRQGNAQQQV